MDIQKFPSTSNLLLPPSPLVPCVVKNTFLIAVQVVNKLWVLFSCFVFCFTAVKAISDDSYPWPITLTVTHLQKLFQFILEGNVFTLSSSIMIFLFFSTFSLLAISAQGSFKLFLSWSFWPFCLPCHCRQIASLKTWRRKEKAVICVFCHLA